MWSTGEDFAWLSHGVVPSLCSVDALVHVGQEQACASVEVP